MSFERVVLVGFLLGIGACRAPHAETAPPLRVNQEGLASRIAQTAPAEEPAVSAQHSEGAEAGPSAAGETQTDPGMVAVPPSAEGSADRISFEKTEPTETPVRGEAEAGAVHAPADDLSSARDPRREEFLRREERRGAQ
jgi:hypothetical protein